MTNAPAAPAPARKTGFWKKLRGQAHLQAMAIPGVIWLLVFCYLPMYGIVIAFKRYNIVKPVSAAPWVGLMHFEAFFADPRFWLVMRNTLAISLLKLAVCFPMPIVFALLLNELRGNRFKRLVQTVSYLPHFLSWVVVGGLLMTWLSETGLVTQFLVAIRLVKEPVSFLGEPKNFWTILVASDLWKEMGWNAIIYLAAMAGIDPALYEAATMDGAGRLRRIWHITLPSIRNTVVILLILSVSSLLNTNFDQIFVLNNPLLYDVSDVIDVFVYRMGMQSGRFSYATAVGLFKAVIALGLLLGANTAAKKLADSSIF